MISKKKAGIIAGVIVFVLAAGGIVWYVSSQNAAQNQTDEPQPEETVSGDEEKDAGEEPEVKPSEEKPAAGETPAQPGGSGNSYPRPAGVNVVSDPSSITTVVNKQNFLPEGWTPPDLVSVGGGQSLRAEAATALSNLRAAAKADGYTFNVISGYRTKQTQASLYSNYMAQDPEGAPYLSAYPRSSEHELGLAMDISPDWSLHYDLLQTGLGQWMTAHAHEYGWILRYPEGKTGVTGYVFEAWHYRYVGVDLATKIKNSGLTLEEYF